MDENERNKMKILSIRIDTEVPLKILMEHFCLSSGGSLEVGRLWMESLNAMDASVKTRQMNLEEALQSFSKDVYGSFEEKRTEERNNLEGYEKAQRQKNGISKKLWGNQKRFLTSQRGAWRAR